MPKRASDPLGPTLMLDRAGGEPLHRQIYFAIRQAILGGALLGQALASADGRRDAQAVQVRILQPMVMASTVVVAEPVGLPRDEAQERVMVDEPEVLVALPVAGRARAGHLVVDRGAGPCVGLGIGALPGDRDRPVPPDAAQLRVAERAALPRCLDQALAR